MSRYSVFLDVAGRVSEKSEGYSSVTAAAIALPTDKVEMARSALFPLPSKWNAASPEGLGKVLEVTLGYSVVALAMRVEKQQPAWSRFWSEARRYRERLIATSPSRAQEASYLKPANIIKYWLFGDPSARAVGECIRREGTPRILDSLGRGVVDVAVICDSDIQGGYNKDIFTFLWENLNRKGMLSKLGINHFTREATLMTEEEEPLLLLPDYLAGVVHTLWGAGEIRPPEEIGRASVEQAYSALEGSGKFVFVPYKFDLRCQDIFGNTSIGETLWPAV